MKNSIFRSYSKKIIKSEAFISLIIVFILAIGIIGTSYALYMDVDTDTDYELVNVGDLSIGFDNGDSRVIMDNMTPTEDDIAVRLSNNIFSFYIYNTGTYSADYNIKLETLEGNEVSSEFINYQICKDNADNCEEINTLSKVDNNIIYKDILSPKKEKDQTNPSVYYFLRVWINNKYTETESKSIKLKVVIDVKNANSVLDNKNTLAGAILNNENNDIVNNNPDLNATILENNKIYKTKDNYGMSYYFRGNSDYNYVLFSSMCFRAYRIEGDGATKLILSDINGDCSSDNWNIGNSNSINNNIYKEFEEKMDTSKLKNTIYCTSNNDTITLECNNENVINTFVSGISKDELILAGYNNSYLSGNYWLVTKDNDTLLALNTNEIKNDIKVTSNRPVITLKPSTLISKGTGSQKNPYVIK